MKSFRTLAVAISVLAGAGGLLGPRAMATHQPANKVSAAGSVLQEMTADVTTGTDSRIVALLRGTLKTSATKDLIIQVAAECSLITNTKTVGDGDSSAAGRLTVWVTIDGRPVPVTNDSNGDGLYRDPDDGKVVFCDRAVRQVTRNFTDDGGDDKDSRETIEMYQQTRSSHSFNWMALNVGRGPHTIAVLGQLDVSVGGVGQSQALVGKRTMVVEPTALANDAVI